MTRTTLFSPLFRLQFLIVLLISSQVVIAQTQPNQEEAEQANWYTVEVISFTRAKTAAMNENWPLAVSPDVAQQLELADNAITDSTTLANIEPVPESEWKLARHAYSVNRAKGLRVKSHQAWRQKGLPREQSPWINLQVKDDTLSGKIRISLSRYLHADIDIRLINPDWMPSLASSPTDTMTETVISREIAFETSRRLRRDRLHYIDHPLGGVLLHIERYEKNVTEKPTEVTSSN